MDANLEEIFTEYDHEKRLMETTSKATLYERLRETVTKRHLRIPFILILLLNIGQNTSGYDAIVNYSTEIFKDLGLSTEESTIASICCLIPGFIGAFYATLFVESQGRRKLLLLSLSLTTLGEMDYIKAKVHKRIIIQGVPKLFHFYKSLLCNNQEG